MDKQINRQTSETSQKEPTGCCGGKATTQTHDKAEPREAEVSEARPVKSGCCCGQN